MNAMFFAFLSNTKTVSSVMLVTSSFNDSNGTDLPMVV